MAQTDKTDSTFSAFIGHERVVRGALAEVLGRCKTLADAGRDQGLLIFEDRSGRQVEFDLTGNLSEVLARACPTEAKSGPGRPKLGVVSREVSLLPRHWQWLEQDPQGISAAIRRLVEEAKKREPHKYERGLLRDAIGRVLWSLAGNLPNFEEASRALFADDSSRFSELTRDWPGDVREHLNELCQELWPSTKPE